MLEKAYAELKGGYTNIVSGTSDDVWTAIKGPGQTVYHPASEYSNAEFPGNAMLLAIYNLLESGKQVVLSIKDHPDPDNPTADHLVVPPSSPLVGGVIAEGGTVHGNHAYVVKRGDFLMTPTGGVQGVRLYNPWGVDSDHPQVIGSDLAKFVEGIYELR